MQRLADRLDLVNHWTGMTVRWFALIMVLLQFTVVLLRYVFGFSSIALNESVLYLHSGLFMLGAGYTLLVDGHVRVDIFYAGAKNRTKAAIDVFGYAVLAIPSMLALLYWTWPDQFDLNDGRGDFGWRHSGGLAFEVPDPRILHSFDYSVCCLLAQADHCPAQ